MLFILYCLRILSKLFNIPSHSSRSQEVEFKATSRYFTWIQRSMGLLSLPTFLAFMCYLPIPPSYNFKASSVRPQYRGSDCPLFINRSTECDTSSPFRRNASVALLEWSGLDDFCDDDPNFIAKRISTKRNLESSIMTSWYS